MKVKTTEMWGIRFSHLILVMSCKTAIECDVAFNKLADDLRKYDAAVMEAEDKSKPYFYLMFRSKEDANEFFEEHKAEKMYKTAKIRLIKEPAYVPKEWVETREKGKA